MIVNITLLLSKCQQFRKDAEILIVCDNDETLLELVKKQHQLIKVLTSPGEPWEQIHLRSNSGEKEATTLYPPKFRSPIKPKSMVHSSILVIPEAEIISEIMKYPNPSSLVEFATDKGLFTNTHIEKSSGAKFSEWIGTNQGTYWIPDELQRFKRLLLKEKELTNFEYQAFFYTGEAASFKVDARLVRFNGDLCRWVRVVDCQVIS